MGFVSDGILFENFKNLYSQRRDHKFGDRGSGASVGDFMACVHRAPHLQLVDLVLMVVYGFSSDHVDGPDKET